MAYSKQNFQNGQILNAANLEAMENGIIAGQGAHNLLDNSDFRIKNNIINTKGLTDYSFNSGDVFDRWRLHWTGDGRVSIKDGYIELYRKTHCAYLFQHPRDLQSMVGKTYTLAAKVRQKGFIGWIDSTQEVNCGLLTLSDWDIIAFTFTVGSATSDIGEAGIEIGTQADSSFDVQWVALYEGVYTKETLPAYVAKGKHVEMLNCGVPLQPRNLLDNSDFTNPVNQQGVTSVVYNQKFIVDKWMCSNVSSDAPISVTTNGITLNNAAGTHTQGLQQYISIKDGVYTVAAKTDSSIWIRTFTYSNKTITNISSSFDGKGEIDVDLDYNDNIYIAIKAFAGYSIKVEWAALYEGSYTADTLPPYVPKGKHVEMLNCGVPLTPHNLLDNTDFSHPIAQAGLNGMHGSTKYVCDRWISYNANATFGGNYIRPGSPIDQRLSKTVIDINKTYTAAFCYADGKIKVESGTFSNGFGSDALGIYCMKQEDSTDYVTVRLNTGKEIHWAALYEGAYDASTLPAYQPKGYAAELAECQLYYENSWFGPWKNYNQVYLANVFSPLQADAKIEFKQQKRIQPTITFYPVGTESNWKISNNGYAIVKNVKNAQTDGGSGFIARITKGDSDNTTWTLGYTIQAIGHWEANADL